MTVALWCVDFMTLTLLFISFVFHISLWITSPVYRRHNREEEFGVTGTFSEKLVR